MIRYADIPKVHLTFDGQRAACGEPVALGDSGASAAGCIRCRICESLAQHFAKTGGK